MTLNVKQLQEISDEYEEQKAEYEKRVSQRFNDVVVRDLMREYDELEYGILYDDLGCRD